MTIYVCRECRTASRTALIGVENGDKSNNVACGACGSGRVETV